MSQFLMKMLFYKDIMRKASDQHIHHIKQMKWKKKKKKKKKAKAIFLFLINQITLVNIHVKNTANLQSRAGRDFLVVCNV